MVQSNMTAKPNLGSNISELAHNLMVELLTYSVPMIQLCFGLDQGFDHSNMTTTRCFHQSSIPLL